MSRDLLNTFKYKQLVDSVTLTHVFVMWGSFSWCAWEVHEPTRSLRYSPFAGKPDAPMFLLSFLDFTRIAPPNAGPSFPEAILKRPHSIVPMAYRVLPTHRCGSFCHFMDPSRSIQVFFLVLYHPHEDFCWVPVLRSTQVVAHSAGMESNKQQYIYIYTTCRDVKHDVSQQKLHEVSTLTPYEWFQGSMHA